MIEHEGIIDQIEKQVARVRIEPVSACSACHAKGSCGASDKEEKYLDVPLREQHFTAGEKVRVQIAKHLGIKAVAFGYLYPFLLLMFVLIALLVAGTGELKAGFIALLSLLPYYVALYIFRKRIASAFTFTLQKTGTPL